MQKYSIKNKNREFQSNQWSQECWYTQFCDWYRNMYFYSM